MDLHDYFELGLVHQDETNRTILSECALANLLSKVTVDLGTGCWNWSGSYDPHGYGTCWDPRRYQTRQVYRILYEHFVGPVPKGLELGHYSQNDKCAFYEHVRPITRGRNIRESKRYEASEEVCRKGHPRIPSNKYTDKNGSTHCKACDRIYHRRSEGYDSCEGCGYAPTRCRCATLWI